MTKADEPKNVKPASTIQDDIPPVHVLEAAERQERKETEDLLSGFDRPGRGPKVAPKERDFVDYYAKKSGGAGSASGSVRAARDSASASAPARAKQGDVSTVIVRRKGDGAPAWLVWGGAALLMLVVGGVVAFLATADGRPEAAAPSMTVPSAATTLTSATTAKPTAADENVPPPAAATAPGALPTVEAPASPRASSAKREPRAVQSGAPATALTAAPRSTNAAEVPKAAPREDFIRDL